MTEAPDKKIKIHEPEYESVSDRIRRFREQYPIESGWSIDTEVKHIAKASIFIHKAGIVSPDNRVTVASATIIQRDASSLNYESFAIGRALFYAGFGKGEVITRDEHDVREELMTPDDLFRNKNRQLRKLKSSMNLESEDGKPTGSGKKMKSIIQGSNHPHAGDTGRRKSDLQRLEFSMPSLNPADYNLPDSIGFGLQVEDGMVVVTESQNGVIYNNRHILKENGFAFNGQTKKWSHPIIALKN